MADAHCQQSTKFNFFALRILPFSASFAKGKSTQTSIKNLKRRDINRKNTRADTLSSFDFNRHIFWVSFLFISLVSIQFALAAETNRNVSVRVCVSAYSAGYLYNIDFAARHYLDSQINETLPSTTSSNFSSPLLKERYWPNIFTPPPLVISASVDHRHMPVEIVRAFIKKDGDGRCDLFIGPAFSDAAVAQSPLIENPMWVDPGASSTLLSNKAIHPAFMRTVPSDDQCAPKATQLMTFFGWSSAFIIKGDSTYANSWATSFSSSFSASGGSVVKVFTVAKFVSSVEEALRTTLLEIRADTSQSRIVIVTDVDFDIFAQVVARNKFTSDLIFIFSEMACSDSSYRAWAEAHGSFCLTTGFDPAYYNAYMDAYNARNITALIDEGILAQLKADGHDQTGDLFGDMAFEMDVYIALAVDALWYGLAVLEKYVSLHDGALPPSSADACAFARQSNVSVRGLTGEVSVDSNGDRKSFVATLYNSAPDNSSVEVGMAGSDGKVVLTVPSVFILGKSYDLRGLSSQQVRAIVPRDRTGSLSSQVDSTDQLSTLLIIIIVIVVGFVTIALIAVAATLVYRWSLRRKRGIALRNAPKDASQPAAIIFTDIQSSTALWAECPMEMSMALDLHNNVVRRAISAHNGYEVKTIGDSFMVAFKSPLDATGFSLGIQQDLYNADWSMSSAFARVMKNSGHRVASSGDEDDEGGLADEEEGNAIGRGIQQAINNFYQSTVLDAFFDTHDDDNDLSHNPHPATSSRQNENYDLNNSSLGDSGKVWPVNVASNQNNNNHSSGVVGGEVSNPDKVEVFDADRSQNDLPQPVVMFANSSLTTPNTTPRLATSGGGDDETKKIREKQQLNLNLSSSAPTLESKHVQQQSAAAIRSRNGASPSTFQHNGLRVRIGGSFGILNIRATAREASGGSRALSDEELDAVLRGESVTTSASKNNARVSFYRQTSKTQPSTAASANSSNSFIDIDSIAFDYFGTVVNTAARIEAVGHGGQILVSRSLLDAATDEIRKQLANLDATTLAPLIEVNGNALSIPIVPLKAFVYKPEAFSQHPINTTDALSLFKAITAYALSHSKINLRSLPEAVELVQLSPPMLAGRSFPPLRLDREMQLDGFDQDHHSEDLNGSSARKRNSTMPGGDCDWLETQSVVSRLHSNGGGGGGGGVGVTPNQNQLNSLKNGVNNRNLNRYYGDMSLTQQVAVRRRLKETDLRLGYFMLDAVLSVVPPREATGLLKTLLQRWRINAKEEAEGLIVHSDNSKTTRHSTFATEENSISGANTSTPTPLPRQSSVSVLMIPPLLTQQQQRHSDAKEGGNPHHTTTPAGRPAGVTDGLRKVLLASRMVPVAMKRHQKAPHVKEKTGAASTAPSEPQ